MSSSAVNEVKKVKEGAGLINGKPVEMRSSRSNIILRREDKLHGSFFLTEGRSFDFILVAFSLVDEDT